MKRHEKGQGLVEYALILVLVAIVVVNVLVLLGPSIDETFQDILDAIMSQSSSETTSAGEPDRLVAEANIMSSTAQTALEWDDAESIIVLWEEAEAQEESLEEGAELNVEAVVEGLEVLIDYADDIDNQALSAALSQLVQDIKDGNLYTVPDVAEYLMAELEELPPEIWSAIILKMAPRLIDACEAVSGGSVSPEAIAAAQLSLEQLDPDHPCRAAALELLQEAVEIIEERENISQDWLAANAHILGFFVARLSSLGEDALAEQLAVESGACGY
jgi:pilus assembly protein Flp/PilA